MRSVTGMLVMTTLILLGACGRGSVNVEQERSALLAADREAGESTANLDTFVGVYTDDATIYPQGTPKITGTGPIREFISKMLGTPGIALQWVPEKAMVGAGGDIGYTTGTYKVTGPGMTEAGKYVSIWKKQADGKWKMTEDIFNADTGMQTEPSPHVMMMPSAVKWGDPPPVLPAGARLAVLAGDPGKAGPFVIRLQFPAGYKVAAHWHPTDELVTVVSGTMALGMGDKFDDKALQTLPTGGFALLPAHMNHFAMARTPAVVQINGMGPFALIYVNPADDPTKKAGQ